MSKCSQCGEKEASGTSGLCASCGVKKLLAIAKGITKIPHNGQDPRKQGGGGKKK